MAPKKGKEAGAVTVTAKVTSKGQVTIPKVIRDSLEVESGDELLFVQRDGRTYIERIPSEVDPDDLYGALHRPGQETVDVKEARQKIRERLTRLHTPSQKENA